MMKTLPKESVMKRMRYYRPNEFRHGKCEMEEDKVRYRGKFEAGTDTSKFLCPEVKKKKKERKLNMITKIKNRYQTQSRNCTALLMEKIFSIFESRHITQAQASNCWNGMLHS
jgi:hypothetical protein